jgi:ribose/xylose/arabinose/galactoside ABC-type transport system permease subunit
VWMGVGGPYVVNRSNPIRSSRDIESGYFAGIPVTVVILIVVSLVIRFVLEPTPIRHGCVRRRR